MAEKNLTGHQESAKGEDKKDDDVKKADKKARATSQQDVVNMFAVDCTAIG